MNISWQDTIGYNQSIDVFFGITEDSENKIVVSGGSSYINPTIDYNGWFVAYDTMGNPLWERIILKNNKSEWNNTVIHTSDGGYALCGSVQVYDSTAGSWSQDVWVVKVDSLGCDIDGCPTILWTSVDELTVSSQNPLVVYPNPFSDFTTIEYTVSSVEDSWIIIYDVTGKIVKRVKLNNTSGNVEINASELVNGVYFCQLLTNGAVTHSTKVILTK